MAYEERRNVILDLSFKFSLDIINYSKLLDEKRKYVIAGQLMKSGTSIGANAREAQNAESKADFIHKMKVADKEAIEVNYWLSLCNYSADYPPVNNLIDQCMVIRRVLGKIISTSIKNSRNP
ncbi:MAG: four helix bundle protein [Gemmatimonadaceae bacterium]|nr:four helix bundle protein [Chitinophagaceae bacterium]